MKNLKTSATPEDNLIRYPSESVCNSCDMGNGEGGCTIPGYCYMPLSFLEDKKDENQGR